jgi:3',5'-nucleoside bisphosphate phosphatase
VPRRGSLAGPDGHRFDPEAIRREAARALDDYGLLVIPGLELSDNYEEPELAAHALALGLSEYVSVDAGIVAALEHANDLRAALVAAHPYTPRDVMPLRATTRIAREPDTFRPHVHRYELFNRDEVFTWVAEAGLPAVASGDVHRAGHVASWKTLPSLREGRDCGGGLPALSRADVSDAVRAGAAHGPVACRLTPTACNDVVVTS